MLSRINSYYSNIDGVIAINNRISYSNNSSINLLLDFANLEQLLYFPFTSNRSSIILNLDHWFINNNSISYTSTLLLQGIVIGQPEPPCLLLDSDVSLVSNAEIVVQQEPYTSLNKSLDLAFHMHLSICTQVGCAKIFKRDSDRIRHVNSIHLAVYHLCQFLGGVRTKTGDIVAVINSPRIFMEEARRYGVHKGQVVT